MSQMIDVSDLVATTLVAVSKGDKPGHPFRGNQHTRGGGGGTGEPRPVASSKIEASKEATEEAALQAANAVEQLEDTINRKLVGSSDTFVGTVPDIQRAKKAMNQDLVQARSMSESGFGIQEDRLAGRNGRSMGGVGKVAKDDYADRTLKYAQDIEMRAAELLNGGNFPMSMAADVREWVSDIQDMTGNLMDAARTLKNQP